MSPGSARAWALVGALGGLVVGLLNCWSRNDDRRVAAERAGDVPFLQSTATRWMNANHVVGVATCSARGRVCDVVPADCRAPFRIMCSIGETCFLHMESR